MEMQHLSILFFPVFFAGAFGSASWHRLPFAGAGGCLPGVLVLFCSSLQIIQDPSFRSPDTGVLRRLYWIISPAALIVQFFRLVSWNIISETAKVQNRPGF